MSDSHHSHCPNRPKSGFRVTTLNHATGETESVEIPPGEYVVITTNPCYVAHRQAFGSGTHQLTIKGRIQR